MVVVVLGTGIVDPGFGTSIVDFGFGLRIGLREGLVSTGLALKESAGPAPEPDKSGPE